MTPADETALDTRKLAALLAEDEALADGRTPPETGSSDPIGDCLRLLEQVWPRSGPATAEAALPRQLDRFEIVRPIDRGGFGVAYLARDPTLGRDVALKLLRPEAALSPEVRRRFVREARLDHPNIVPVHEAGELGPIGYLVATYCAGPTLAAWLKARNRPVPAPSAARLVAALADAVQHARDRGILHRDLKPSNVLLQVPPGGDRSPGPDDPVPRITGRAQSSCVCAISIALRRPRALLRVSSYSSVGTLS